VLVEEDATDLGGAAEVVGYRCLVGEPSSGLEPDGEHDLGEQRPGRRYRGDGLPARPACPWRVDAPAEVGDHEQEHDHHRSRIDQHLGRRDELRRQEQEEHGERAEVADQRERRVEGVREADDRDPGSEARERRDHPDDPDENAFGAHR
jgi:hypothetical protein